MKLRPIQFNRQRICSACTCRAYLNRSQQRRDNCARVKINDPENLERTLLLEPLWVTHAGRASAISLDTIRNDLKRSMRSAGLRHPWTPHNLRGASASKVDNLGGGRERVLKHGRWASEKSFLDYYFRQDSSLGSSSRNRALPIWNLLRVGVHF